MKPLFTLLLIMSTIFSSLFGQSYDQMWEKVTTAQKKDLPRDVLTHSQQIYQKASKDKNFPQLLKSWVTIVQTECELDPENFRIANFPPLPHKGEVQTALYNAIMGQAYLVMKDTHISENDIETQIDYSQKASELFDQALSNKPLLAATSAKDYEPLISKGKDSQYYSHDLLSLLTRFVIEHSEMKPSQVAQLCDEVAAYYKEHGNTEGYTLMALKRLQALSQHEDYNLRLNYEDYTQALKTLVDETKDTETGADVAALYVERIGDNDEKLDFARWAMKQYHPAEYRRAFENVENAIMQSHLHIYTASGALANHPNKVTIQGENITKAQLIIRKFNGRDKNQELKTDGALVLERNYTLCADSLSVDRRAKGYPTKGESTDQITLPAGHYVFEAKSGKLSSVDEVCITSLRLFAFTLPDKKILAQVLDNESGRPVPGALLTLKERSDKVIKTMTCDEQGECIIDTHDLKANYLFASLPGTDDFTSDLYLHEWDNSNRNSSTYNIRLYTDREIYRPGQTVHVSGIIFQQAGDEVHVLDNESESITIQDANWQKLHEVTVRSNELGSFSFDYELPKNVMPGQFRIRSSQKTITIRVEEYKRPTFQVEAHATQTEASQASFSFGDTIQVEALAQAFSGVPVQGAKVHYKVESAEVSFWRWFDADWSTLAQGDTLTDQAGKAIVPVLLNPKDLNGYFGVVRYRVTFDVTDQAGETQSSSYSLAVSQRTFSLNIKAASEVDLGKQAPAFTIQAINANRADVDVQGTFTLTLDDSAEKVLTLPFQSNQPIQLPTDLTPGTYTIRASATDRDGSEITDYATISLYNSQTAIDLNKKGASTAVTTAATRFHKDFILASQSIFSEQQPAQVLFSPVHEDVLVSYMILSNDAVIARKQLLVGRQQYQLTIPYAPQYGDGVTLTFWYVRNGHTCQQQVKLTYQTPDKALRLSWSTFRDKLYPGQNEEWTLTIHNSKGQAVPGAELLATMYDASLDQIAPHYWNFGLNFDRYIRSWTLRLSSDNRNTSLSSSSSYSMLFNPDRTFDELTQYLHDRYRFNNRRVFTGAGRPMLMRSKLMDMAPSAIVEDAMPMMEMASASIANNEVIETEASVPDAPNSAPQEVSAAAGATIRTNFSETAFFYPHLLSDANGDVRISFTLPESLTEWKFMGLAHTADVMYGQITARAVARKDFMVQPNMPRFVREGDQAVISARVINQSETELQGTTQIRLIDPETDQVVFSASQPFSVAGQQTTSVSFQANISDQYPMLICEVSGSTGTFSDGERNYLPVLSSKKYITEAVPFWMTNEETEKRIDVSSLFNEGSATATHRRLLLEFTEHPEWTVIEALDGIKLPEHDNVPCYAASLYANTMASRLAQSIPGFQQALLWAREHNVDAQSLLEENQDLKEIILSNSPWVRDALAEREQRSRLLDLFDQDLITQRTRTAKDKLQQLQKGNGSWSWFEGMEGSYYITLTTCMHLAMLQSADPSVRTMLQRGLKYLDEQEYEAYKERLKHKQSGYSLGSLEYLYVCSFLPDRTVDKDILKMRQVYLKELQKQVRDLTIQGRAKAACVLRAFGLVSQANDFLESAVQYTVTRPGMGRYYATDAAYYSWCDYRIPTQLATMRALRQSDRADRAQLINEMQLWLIRQKQSQGWDSPINTISAVDFLLNGANASGSASPATQPAVHQPANHTFVLDGQMLPAQVDSTRFLADQLGYIRSEIPAQLYGQSLTELVVSAPSNDTQAATSLIAWGGLYAQYLEDMDRLNQQSSGELKVSVKLIKGSGNTSEPVTELHVGDEVTLRVILTADRDMDFVQLRLQRPACFEPVNQLSGYRWMNGRGGYVAQHDASTDIFFDTFRRGTMTYDLTFRIDRPGEYLSGVTTAQCAYAPEFCAHTGAVHVVVK